MRIRCKHIFKIKDTKERNMKKTMEQIFRLFRHCWWTADKGRGMQTTGNTGSALVPYQYLSWNENPTHMAHYRITGNTGSALVPYQYLSWNENPTHMAKFM